MSGGGAPRALRGAAGAEDNPPVPLLLMRHAEAAVSNGRPDHERPLTDRGRADAAAVGRWLRANGLVPDVVWCSSARRAQETWAAASAALDAPPEPSYSRAVYQAGPGDLLDLLVELPGTISTALILGHNPTMAHTLAAVTGESRGFPAGAVAEARKLDIDAESIKKMVDLWGGQS